MAPLGYNLLDWACIVPISAPQDEDKGKLIGPVGLSQYEILRVNGKTSAKKIFYLYIQNENTLLGGIFGKLSNQTFYWITWCVVHIKLRRVGKLM